MHFPNIFIRFFAFVSSFLFPKHTHAKPHTHTRSEKPPFLQFFVIFFSVSRFLVCSVDATTGAGYWGRPNRAAAADWRTPTLSNVTRWRIWANSGSFPLPPSHISNYFPHPWKVVSFNVSVIEQEKWKRKKIAQPAPVLCRPLFPEKSKRNISQTHIILCFSFFILKFCTFARTRAKPTTNKTTRM